MGKTLAEKILSERSGTDTRAGDIVVTPVDLVMAHDSSGPLMIRQLAALGFERPGDPERTVLVLDHYGASPNKALANDQQTVREFAARTGSVLHDVGDGICHQVLAERYIRPGDVVIGADSHTCMGGALAAFSTGMGATDVAVAAAIRKTWLRVPGTLRVEVSGVLGRGVYAKDVILKLIGTIGSDGATYMALEYGGEAVAAMSMSERFTLSNMAVEAGAKVGVCASDEHTRQYLEQQGRPEGYRPLAPDADASYERVVRIHAGALQPMVAKPHLVDNVAPVAEVEGTHVDRVFIGSCTNTRLDDLAIAAGIIKGHRRHPGTRLIVVPGSRQVAIEAARAGYLEIFMEAGAAVLTPGCNACPGSSGGVPGDGEVVLSTQNRNFRGRMGNPESSVYLGSPATAAATAIAGSITDPRRVL